MRAVLVGLSLCLWSVDPPANTAPGKLECTCNAAIEMDGWCESCGVGFVAGLRLKSKLLFEVVDNHGHDVDMQFVRCPSCLKAIESDGFCKDCRIGYVRRMAYFSALTFAIAKGQRFTDPTAITCEMCRRSVKDGGWCEDCGRGWIGNVAANDKELYEAAAVEFDRLKCAAADEGCPTCALAKFTGGFCPACRIQYKDGKPLPAQPEGSMNVPIQAEAARTHPAPADPE